MHLPRFATILCLAAALAAAGCSQQGFRVSNLAKADMDFAYDTGYRLMDQRLRQLADKLYRRNPRELRKGLVADREARVNQLFARPGPLRFSELGGVSGIDAINLALAEDYAGDRVFALMAGLVDMVRASYHYKTEFFMLDRLDPDKLYKSARNIEILVWRLAHSRDAGGNLLLLSNSRGDEPRNLSYMRLFGEMIAIQEMMAEMIAQKHNRMINRVTINMATLVFFPL